MAPHRRAPRALLALSLLSSFPSASAATRYHLCAFTCAHDNSSWTACRAERCTPRLAEDLCADGAEPRLSADGSPRDGDGRPLAGPHECAAWGAAAGSFAERCEICTRLAAALVDIASSSSSSSPSPSPSSSPSPSPSSSEAEEEEEGCERGEEACLLAQAQLADALPQHRSCALSPEACAALVARLANATNRASVCRGAHAALAAGRGAARVMEEARRTCGEALSLRLDAGVEEARVCAAARDIGGRVMALAAVVALGTFALQLTQA